MWRPVLSPGRQTVPLYLEPYTRWRTTCNEYKRAKVQIISPLFLRVDSL